MFPLGTVIDGERSFVDERVAVPLRFLASAIFLGEEDGLLADGQLVQDRLGRSRVRTNHQTERCDGGYFLGPKHLGDFEHDHAVNTVSLLDRQRANL